MSKILFWMYFVKLRLKVWFGFHRTMNPLNAKWRWKYWNDKRKRKIKNNESKFQKKSK